MACSRVVLYSVCACMLSHTHTQPRAFYPMQKGHFLVLTLERKSPLGRDFRGQNQVTSPKVTGSSAPFLGSGLDEPIGYFGQSYSDFSGRLVTTHTIKTSKWVEFFEDSYISHFLSKSSRLPSQKVNMWCIHI